MLQDNNEQAIKFYQESFRLQRKKNRQRKKILDNNYDSILFLIALLKSDDEKLFTEAITYINDTIKNNNLRYTNIFHCLLYIFKERCGLIQEPLHSTCKQPTKNYTITETFLHFLVLNWLGIDFSHDFIDSLVKIQQRAQASDYDWQTAESSLLLAKLGHEAKNNQQLGKKLHQKQQTHSLVDIVTPLAEWEKVLISLDAVSQSTEPQNQKHSVQERLLWHFSYDSDDHSGHIYPRVQKMTKAGNWSKGRAAALKTLYHDSGKMDYLTEQDRIVISSIKIFTYGYYRSRDYIFDASRSLPALVGHPLVFLENNPEIQIELILGKAELTIEKKDNDQIFLSLEPCPKYQNQNIMVVAETPTRYRVIEITPEYEKISQVIGEGVILPKKAETMARRTAVSLSGLVTIQSDLGGDRDTREIAGDPRPHLHLLPYQDGLSVSFRVKPFNESGASFMPGVGGRVVMAEIDQEKVQARRELEKERKLAQKVIIECPVLQNMGELDHEWLVEEPQDALELLLELKSLKEGEIFLEWPQGEKFKVRRELSLDNFSLKIKRDRDWFKASGKLNVDDELTLNLKQLLAAMDQAKGRFLPLDDNTFIAITNKLRRRLKELDDYSEAEGNDLRFNPLARLAMNDISDGIKNFSSDKVWREQGQRLKEIITPKIPSTFQAQLRDYQIQGFNWLAQLSHWRIGACLADDMGLGKTLQALAVILTRAAAGPTLVAAPLSVIGNWEEECKRFAPTLKPRLFGPGDRRKMLDEAGPFDLIITSYGLLQIESEKLKETAWQTVVLDEAQAIKNMQTKRSKAAMQLKAEFKLITTGTPIENHLGELWTLYTFLNPGLLGSYKWFQEKFALPIEKNRDQEANLSLKKLIQPFILRRLKSEVLQELPAKTEITLKVEMSPEEASLYEAQRLRSLASLADDGNDLP
ncbi:MAG: SNF2-related protein, partial [Pseudomonadota bacterium]|nr:SNF2-related protein [Pseudomonadota bacterium]